MTRSKRKANTKTLTEPIFIQVNDYHEFHTVQRVLRLIDKSCKVHELNVEDYGIGYDEICPYVAIVYSGRRPSNSWIRERLHSKKFKLENV